MLLWLPQAAQAAEGEVQHRGRYVVRIDATEALHPYDLSAAVAPELASVAMENVLHIPVMDDTTAIVGCAHLVLHTNSHACSPRPDHQ